MRKIRYPESPAETAQHFHNSFSLLLCCKSQELIALECLNLDDLEHSRPRDRGVRRQPLDPTGSAVLEFLETTVQDSKAGLREKCIFVARRNFRDRHVDGLWQHLDRERRFTISACSTSAQFHASCSWLPCRTAESCRVQSQCFVSRIVIAVFVAHRRGIDSCLIWIMNLLDLYLVAE